MAVKTKRLVLDRQHLIAMLSDPLFYKECPVFLWLRDTGLAAAKQYDLSKTRRCCGGDWRLIRPTVDGFFRVLRSLHAEDPANVECVREYLERKKGYRPVPVVIYYRSSSKGRAAKFQF